MSELRDLYQEVILDHHKKPRNKRVPAEADRRADGHNPLCGDRITVHLHVADGIVRDVGFEGSGCAISTASASMMTEAIKGKTAAHAENLIREFHALLTGGTPDKSVLGKLEVFSGVNEFPVRVKCATLAWHTLRNALNQTAATAVTE